MPVTLIEQKPNFIKKVDGSDKLAIAEMFANTIQGEGVNAGHPATFIRLQGCTLDCVWCDTLEVWRYGNEYSFDEILDLLTPFADKYMFGDQHIVLTGGSPLKQQDALVRFLQAFEERFSCRPIIEVENEAVKMPSKELIPYVYCWNNSPKLANSGMKYRVRVKPEVLATMADLDNSWFKFVVDCEEDWEEILNDYLPYINKSQVILMPQGQTQEELNQKREIVADMAIRHQVKFSDRLHVTIWNKKTGV